MENIIKNHWTTFYKLVQNLLLTHSIFHHHQKKPTHHIKISMADYYTHLFVHKVTQDGELSGYLLQPPPTMTKFHQRKCTQLHRHIPEGPKPLSLRYPHAPKRNWTSKQLLKYNTEINGLRSANKLTVQTTEILINPIKASPIAVKIFQRTIPIAVPETTFIQVLATNPFGKFFINPHTITVSLINFGYPID